MHKPMSKLFKEIDCAIRAQQLGRLLAQLPVFTDLRYEVEPQGNRSIIITNIATDSGDAYRSDNYYWRQKSLCLSINHKGNIQWGEIDRPVRVIGLWEPGNPKDLQAIIRPLPEGLRPQRDWTSPQSLLGRLLSSVTPRVSFDSDTQLQLSVIHMTRIVEKTGFIKSRLPRFEETLLPDGCIKSMHAKKVRFQLG